MGLRSGILLVSCAQQVADFTVDLLHRAQRHRVRGLPRPAARPQPRRGRRIGKAQAPWLAYGVPRMK
jgi:hypothetical protein